MVKKIFAQIALAIFINILILPVGFALGPQEDSSAETGPIAPGGTSAGAAGTSTDIGEGIGAAGIGSGLGAEAAEVLALANVFKDLKPCINELKRDAEGNLQPNNENPDPGPDSNYLISIIEEPLNVTPDGETPKDRYVVRACFRNTFQYIGSDKKFHSVPMLATQCSQNAQDLAKNSDPKYKVKYSCKEVMVILTKGGTTAIYGYINLIYRWGAGMVGIIAVTVIILSGIQISASGGDSEATGAAKKRIIQSIAGIVVLFLSSLILYTINPNFFTK